MKLKFVFALMFFTLLLLGQDYHLDKSFGNQGVSLVNFPGEEVFAIAYDGVIWDDSYLVECFMENDDDDENTIFMKFDKNGNLDTSFADNGKLIISGWDYEGPVSFTILPNDNIALTGIDSLDNFIVYEYDKSGKADKILTIDSLYNLFYPSAIISNNENIFIGGAVESGWPPSEDELFIMKIDFEGKIDSTFGEDGLFFYSKDSLHTVLNALSFYDGGVLFSSVNYDNSYDEINFSLSKLDDSGKLDQSFGENGITEIEQSDYFDDGDYAELNFDNDLNIFFRIAGSPFIAKIDKAGNPVMSYGENGVFVPDTDLWVNALMGFSKILDDGSILEFGGSNVFFDESQSLIMKISPDGFQDTTFGYNGFITGFFGGNSIFYNGILNEDGTFIALGAQGNDVNRQNVLIAKYKPIPNVTKEINRDITGFKVFPNPVIDEKFNLVFDLNKKSKIEISLFSVKGNKIQTLFKGDGMKGENNFKFNVQSRILPGTYLLKLMTENQIRYKKINILK